MTSRYSRRKVTTSPQLVPYQQDDCRTFVVASWHIRKRLTGGLGNVCKALALLEVEIPMLQEKQLMEKIHTHSIAASHTTSCLVLKEARSFQDRGDTIWAVNMVIFQLVMGRNNFTLWDVISYPTILTHRNMSRCHERNAQRGTPP